MHTHMVLSEEEVMELLEKEILNLRNCFHIIGNDNFRKNKKWTNCRTVTFDRERSEKKNDKT